MVGARGGVGASALAANLAWLAGHMQDGRRAALVDLDLQFGSAALALDIEPGRGLADALRTPSRIDDLLIERASVKIDEQFSVLCAEGGLELPLQVDPTAIESLIERLRAGFDCVIVEMPRSLVPSQSQLIAAADAILVVADYTLVLARDCPRLLTRLKEARPKGSIKVAVNRVGAPGHGEIKRPDLEKALGTKVDVEIPHDAQTASQSLQAGKPMVVAAKKAKTCDIIRSLAMDICDMAPAAQADAVAPASRQGGLIRHVRPPQRRGQRGAGTAPGPGIAAQWPRRQWPCRKRQGRGPARQRPTLRRRRLGLGCFREQRR